MRLRDLGLRPRTPRGGPLVVGLFLLLFMPIGMDSSWGQSGTVQRLLGASGSATTYVRQPIIAMAGPAGSGGGSILENGDFSTGLDGWIVSESGGSIIPGTVTEVSGVAQFLEGDSFLVTLQQTVLLPAFATELRFDLIQSPGFDLTSSFLPDAFELSVLDENAFPLVDPWTLGASSCFNVQENGTILLGNQASFDGLTVTIDVSGIPGGTTVALYFDFINADLDTAGGVQIDNASFTIDPPTGAFRRGDVDGDATIDTTDSSAVLDLLFGGGSLPIDCTGAPLLEVADANDNEWITIADALALRNAALGGPPLAAPSSFCDFDPTTDEAGFDQVDPAYRATAGDVVVDPPSGGVDRDVFIPVLVDVGAAATGMTLILEYDDALLTPFDPVAGDGEPFESTLGTTAVLTAPGQMVLSVWATNDGDTLVPAAPGTFQAIGTLRFHLADFVVLPSPNWLPEVDLSGVSYRATLVDQAFADHHPELLAGEGEFARGDSNDDGVVDISDVVFALEYLFVFGPIIPCFDAADVNNDSVVDISDSVYLLAYLFIFGPPPPAPFPACGSDVGPIDLLSCEESACQP
ncbi:MAG: dockerin type I repeat-containing protein [Planctomycetes bacterium]|nr:dockerin type I repeat-containing protein [Planctomycetota bacterium]